RPACRARAGRPYTWPGRTPFPARPPSVRSARWCGWASPRSWRDPGRVELGGILHRLDDLHIAGAAADVAAERFHDLVVARMRIGAQQPGGRHDEARGAVAALRPELFV